MSSLKVEYEWQVDKKRWKCSIFDGRLETFGYNLDENEAYEQALARYNNHCNHYNNDEEW